MPRLASFLPKRGSIEPLFFDLDREFYCARLELELAGLPIGCSSTPAILGRMVA